MIKGKIIGIDKLEARLKSIVAPLTQGQKSAVQQSAILIHGAAVKLIQKTSSGASMIRYSPKRNVTVSKPGDAPNTDTGRLIQSLKFEFGDENGNFVAYVGSNLSYAKHLEFGTDKMEPRPFLSTAMRTTQKERQKIFDKHFKDSVKKAVKR
jgi:HK97 gp10 family phage protein